MRMALGDMALVRALLEGMALLQQEGMALAMQVATAPVQVVVEEGTVPAVQEGTEEATGTVDLETRMIVGGVEERR
ncbi:hypothetical protein BDV98DRAFT_652027, partial [Pterulicium gracile]